MRYFHAYGFVFRSPQWLTNLAVGSLCILVPILGPMVFFGYIFDILETLHRGRPERSYPDFDFKRLLHYLVRGAWVFLVQLILQAPLGIVGMIGYLYFYIQLLMTMTPATPGGPPSPPQVNWGLLGAFAGAFLIGSILVAFLTIPLSLRAGLGQDFASAFSWRFLRDFIGRTWLEIILVELFLMVTGVVVGVLGLLACFIGIYPASALTMFARYHLWYQLYELYLERGGEPIPLKNEDEPPGPPDEHIVAADEDD